MKTPVLTYQSMRIAGADYAQNDLAALAADLRAVHRRGLRIVPLRDAVDAFLAGKALAGCVALACGAGPDFDFRDLDHPTAGRQRSAINVLRDFAAGHPGARPHLTSFVIVSPEARAALDRACMLGRGWWSDDWWQQAVASGLMHVANDSWDHHHDALPESFSLGVERGTFTTIADERLADHEIRQAVDFLRRRVPNPGTALFAYPYGEPSDYVLREYLPRFGAELGLLAAFTDRPGFIEPGGDRWLLPRFVCGRDWRSPTDLEAILDAATDPARTWHAPGAAALMMAPPKARAAPRAAPPPRPAQLAVSMAPPTTVGRGLMPISFELDGPVGDYVLRIDDAAGALAYARRFDLAERPLRITACINSHLLPNGTSTVSARVTSRNQDAWTNDIALQVENTGPLAQTVRRSLREFGTPGVLETPVDSTSFDARNPDLRPWFDRPDALEHLARERRLGHITAVEERTLAEFVANGYLLLPEPLEEELLRQVDAEIDDAIASRVEDYQYGTSQRIHNLHRRYPGVRALWQHPGVMRHLQLIFGVPARACQTLTYVFGSQQGAHQDAIHLTPFPAGYMCGVWVALEDVKPQSGELEVYSGSHRLPRVYMSDAGCPKVVDDDWGRFGDTVAARWRALLAENDFEKVTYRPKRGSVLIWHENLMHAGGVRIDASLSRRSIVSHYFAEGAIAYYDSTGMPGHME